MTASRSLLQSMTGYGAASDTAGDFRVAIRSVNHRFLELRFRSPSELTGLEHEVGRRVKSRVQRGHVEITITRQSDPSRGQPRLDVALASRLVDDLRRFAEENALPAICLRDVLAVPGVVTTSGNVAESDPTDPVFSAVEVALDAFVVQRIREGERLATDLIARCENLESTAQRLEARFAASALERRSRLIRRAQAFLTDLGSPDRSRATEALSEVVALLDRTDVTEELVRARSHLVEFLHELREGASGTGSGKKLEFLVQELLREFNTVGSKSSDAEMTQLVVDAKCELERIREQVANLQ